MIDPGLFLAWSSNPWPAAMLAKSVAEFGYAYNMLCSVPYLSSWKERGPKGAALKQGILDCGAFTEWNTIKKNPLSVDEFCDIAETLPEFGYLVAMDVIGQPETSLKNAAVVAARFGAERAMPVFHIGEPLDLLREYCRLYPYVGISCRFGEPVSESMAFYEACFAEAWPHRFHSFGWISTAMLRAFPVWTADAASWTVPYRFGTFKGEKVAQTMEAQVGGETIREMRQAEAEFLTYWEAVWKKEGFLDDRRRKGRPRGGRARR